MDTGLILKRHLRHDLPQACGGSKSIFPVWRQPLEIFYYARGQVSGSMKSDTINMIHKSQQSTKEGSNKELEGDFISRTQNLQKTILDE